MMINFLDAWLARRTVGKLPAIQVSTTLNYRRAFTSPSADVTATIRDAAAATVASATYSVSPLNDRIYVFQIDVNPSRQRQGFGLAVLHYLAKTYGTPITPIKELFSAASFWTAARKLQAMGIHVTEQLSIGDMGLESHRWQHLRPDVEHLEMLIQQRLYVQREPWHIAVGRGLEKDDPQVSPPS